MKTNWITTAALAVFASYPAWGDDVTPIPSPGNGTIDVPFGMTDGGPVATDAGSGLYGMGKFARGVGEYNLNTARAIREIEEARARNIQNHKLAVETWYDLKRQNKEFRADELAPLTTEQLTRIIEARRPERLTIAQYSPVTGKLSWPAALLGSAFASDREALEHGFATRTSRDGGPDSTFHMMVRDTTDRMLEKLRDRIDQVSPNEFMAGKKFLVGLKYEAGSPANATALAMAD
ncbi:MAG TPA: hypothetical protein VFB96_19380 [Pirellulaceae bacterium]|nr:hypothetical protein [Pirellulaceae bacterium]